MYWDHDDEPKEEGLIVLIINFICFLHKADNGYITFVMLVNSNLDINLNLENGLDKFINGLCLYPQRSLTAGIIIKSGVKVDHPSDVVIKARCGLRFYCLYSLGNYIL